MRDSVPVSVTLTILGFAILLLCAGPVQTVGAQTTRWQGITAFRSVEPVSLNSTMTPQEWSDTLQFYDHFSGLTVAFKQNGTGLLMLVQWQENQTCTSCYAAIRLGSLNNSAAMGTPTTPILIIYISPSLTGDVDEAISNGTTPVFVQSLGYKTQTTCGLNLSSGEYTAQCYRPFQGSDEVPLDFSISLPSSVELGLSTGSLTDLGSYMGTDMSTYVLFTTNETYLAQTVTTETFETVVSASSSPDHSLEYVILGLCAALLVVLGVIALRLRSQDLKARRSDEPSSSSEPSNPN